MIFEEPDGATPLDPDEAVGLKLSHISTREELNRWEQENINQAYSWCERRRNKKNVVSEEFLTTLHKQMFGKVWQWAGDFRRSEKSIGIDWVQVPIELRQLINDMNYWIEHETFPSDEIAVRFHHRLVWIHLFPNGNGRHARLATDRLLMDVFGLEPFTWGSTNIDNQGNVRSQYIQALRQADNHDYSGLVEFVRT
ncbi:cell filamentation protein Fic [Roseivirga spongicola]|uniref:Cell filamentation protein Fic n=2 Tax=Roseivirgaceae TaxID=2762306 RepID=A0A150WZN7_9BACT|nr:cell filamentation protein Fic [Roseivirga spongicola]